MSFYKIVKIVGVDSDIVQIRINAWGFPEAILEHFGQLAGETVTSSAETKRQAAKLIRDAIESECSFVPVFLIEHALPIALE